MRFISAMLAITTAFSCSSVISVNAEEVVAEEFEFVSIPENIYDRTPENIFDGAVIKITYSDNSTENYTLSKENLYSLYNYNGLNEYGFGESTFLILKNQTYIACAAANFYVGECIKIAIDDSILGATEENNPSAKTINYPDDFTPTQAFVNNNMCYKVNPDNTLTLNAHISTLTSDPLDNGENVVIPDSLYDMPVTTIGENVYYTYAKPHSVTIPDTVTEIGYHSYGYHIKKEVIDAFFEDQLEAAADNKSFDIDIFLKDENYSLQKDLIIRTYFGNNAKYSFMEDVGLLSIKATKSQILSIVENDENLSICNSRGSEYEEIISEPIFRFIKNPDNANVLMDVDIEIYSEENAKEIADKYFDSTTTYTIDVKHYNMHATVKAEQVYRILKGNYNIKVNVPDIFDENLYLKYITADENTTFTIWCYFYNDSEDNKLFEEIIKEYFPGCEYEISTAFADIYGVTKKQLDKIIESPVENCLFNTFSEPEYAKIKDFIVYGKKGSAAEKYAIDNGFTFINSDYSIGDINLDKSVNIQDVTMLQRHFAETITLNETQLSIADVNNDNNININDANAIQRMIAS